MENPELIQETIDALENGTGGSTGCVTDIVNCHDQMDYMSDQTGLSTQEVEEIITVDRLDSGIGRLCDCTEDPESGSFEECVEDRICEDNLDRFDDQEYVSDPRLRCILDKFQSEENQALCDVINRFMFSTRSNLVIDDTYPLPDRKASTSPKEGGWIRIRFDKDYVQEACEVYVMKTLLHELIHAEFRAFVDDPTVDPLDFAEIFEAYRNKEDWDHEVMAKYYRERIEQSLRDIYGDQFSDEQYEALAWEGLGEVQIVDVNGNERMVTISPAWDDLKQTEKDRIIENQEGLRSDCDNDGLSNYIDETKDISC